MANSYLYFNLGYRMSKVNTLADVDKVQLSRYLIARDIECEYPPCHTTAVGILTHTSPFYLCSEHLIQAEMKTFVGQNLVKDIISALNHEVEMMKRLYYDRRDGTETVVVVKQPGVSTLPAAHAAAAGLSALEDEIYMPVDEEVLLELFP